MTTSQSKTLCQRLSALGIKQELVRPIVDLVHKWKNANGPEWTVARLKALKTDYVRFLAGEDPCAPWVSRKSNGTPRGPFGSLWKLPKGKYQRALSALMIYSSEISTHVTQKQFEKFKSSVERASVVISRDYLELIEREAPKILGMVPLRGKVPCLMDFIPSNSRRCPTYQGNSVSETEFLETLNFLWETTCGREFSNSPMNPQVADALFPLNADVSNRKVGMTPSQLETLPEGSVGKISFLQEPGFKLRAVANPNRLLQLALRPLGDQLYAVLKRTSWDCTYNQSEGIKWAQAQLLKGKVVHSIDLSDATNNFPLEIQSRVLKGIGASADDVNLFERISRAPWIYKDPRTGKSETLRWTVGQPLGLYPSFAAFALTHGLLVAQIERFCSKSDTFRVLGDDIVIADETVNFVYRSRLKRWQVPISESKTITSNQLAEFGGMVILPDQILYPYKWRELSDHNFLEVLKRTGPSGFGLLRPKQREVAKLLAPLPEPWGLGWNPKGVSLSERLSGFEEFLAHSRDEFVTLTDAKRWFETALSKCSWLCGTGLPSQQNLRWSLYLRDLIEWKAKSDQDLGKPHKVSPIVNSLIDRVGIRDITLDSENEDLVASWKRRGFRRTTRESSDPRGPTLLHTLERKLLDLVKAPDQQELKTNDLRLVIESYQQGSPLNKENTGRPVKNRSL